MSDGEKTGGGAGKIVLIVVLVLLGLGLVCCVGGWFLGGRDAAQAIRASIEMVETAQKDLGEGATVMVIPDDEGRMSLVVAFRDEPDAARIPEFQDCAWKAYAKAFAAGGMDVEQVGVGKVAESQTGVAGWKANAVPAADVAARTGVPAPPRAAWLDKLGGGKVKVQVGGSGDTEK